MVNTFKVKVYPKDLKAIPDIMPFNKLIQGDPVELELNKNEIIRCMNFGDVFDMTSGDEVLIDELSVKELEEFKSEEDEGTDEGDPEAITKMGAIPNLVQSEKAVVVESAEKAPDKPAAKPQTQNTPKQNDKKEQPKENK